MLATPTGGLLSSARLLLPRAIRETGVGTRNGVPCDATGASFCMRASHRMSRGLAGTGAANRFVVFPVVYR
jgi:hypothetical protein